MAAVEQLQAILTEIGTVELDASVSETHTSAGVATDHPVESGGNISDHFHQQPRRVTIEGVISNHPIRVPGTQADGVGTEDVEFEWTEEPGPGALGAVVGAVSDLVGANENKASAMGFTVPFNRVQDADQEMDRLLQLGEPIVVITALRTYENMVLEEYTATREPGMGHELRFTVSAKQVRIVETELTAAIPDPAELRGAPPLDKGKKAPKKEDGPSAKTSLLKQGLAAATSLAGG